MNEVLLVENDCNMKPLSATLPHSIGITKEVHIAKDGQQALNLFNEYYQGSKALPNFILLDLNMPLTDGFEFVEVFQRLDLPSKGQVKVIIVSSCIDPMEEERAKRLGAHQYFLKPLRAEHVMNALNT